MQHGGAEHCGQVVQGHLVLTLEHIYEISSYYDGEGEGDDDGEEEAEADAPKEDPEVVALKEEIEQLEKSLSKTQSSLQYALDQCEEYSKTGYARKVAEMENMRRVRSVSTTRFYHMTLLIEPRVFYLVVAHYLNRQRINLQSVF